MERRCEQNFANVESFNLAIIDGGHLFFRADKYLAVLMFALEPRSSELLRK